MYVDGTMLFAIYFIAVLALAVSAYSLWSLEEIRQYYSKRNNKQSNTQSKSEQLDKKRSQATGYYDKFIGK
jgi:CHASE3 domain sensor protein